MASLEQPAPWLWDDAASQRWLTQPDERESPLEPVLETLLRAAELQPGERVLDVGCGAGPTTVAAAARVSPLGHVTGTDVSPAMIETARKRWPEAQVEWVVGDAERQRFPVGGFDAVISRFGVMFFADPVRAFANLACACREGGRLVVTVWPLRNRSDYFTRPLQVLLQTGERLGLDLSLPPVNGGPFSLGDPARTRRLLTEAGWHDVSIHVDPQPLYLGGPGVSEDEAVDYVLSLGPALQALINQPDRVLDEVRSDLRGARRQWRDDTGFALPGGVLTVSARR